MWSLYKNGVGFFEHTGRVTGDQSVTIDFTSAQLNDVLQTLTAIDLGGGRISGAGYNSTTPLDQQLKSLSLGLGSDATDLDFYQAIRGARVEVIGAGGPMTGRLLSIGARPTAEKDNQPGIEHRFVTVVSDAGQVRTVELTGSTRHGAAGRHKPAYGGNAIPRADRGEPQPGPATSHPARPRQRRPRTARELSLRGSRVEVHLPDSVRRRQGTNGDRARLVGR